jgi:hypothetical protein
MYNTHRFNIARIAAFLESLSPRATGMHCSARRRVPKNGTLNEPSLWWRGRYTYWHSRTSTGPQPMPRRYCTKQSWRLGCASVCYTADHYRGGGGGSTKSYQAITQWPFFFLKQKYKSNMSGRNRLMLPGSRRLGCTLTRKVGRRASRSAHRANPSTRLVCGAATKTFTVGSGRPLRLICTNPAQKRICKQAARVAVAHGTDWYVALLTLMPDVFTKLWNRHCCQ